MEPSRSAHDSTSEQAFERRQGLTAMPCPSLADVDASGAPTLSAKRWAALEDTSRRRPPLPPPPSSRSAFVWQIQMLHWGSWSCSSDTCPRRHQPPLPPPTLSFQPQGCVGMLDLRPLSRACDQTGAFKKHVCAVCTPKAVDFQLNLPPRLLQLTDVTGRLVPPSPSNGVSA